jgi:DNA polymerase-3 subunit delta'
MTAFAPWQQQAWDRAMEAHALVRLPHALLVCGPAHLGKRAWAEALARRLLCRAASTDTGCGECSACRSFDTRFQRDPVETRPDDSPAHPAGHPGHPDARFVGFVLNDKASPKKMYSELVIEQIRELSAWLVLSPQHGQTKVALIEPAHQLTVPAANALLKTLEEPVPGRYLILVSDQPHRLPATIRSRCQRLEFKLPATSEALAWLQQHGVPAAAADAALRANSGNPGLALHELRADGAALRQAVVTDLAALATRRARRAEVAQAWLDDTLARRLQFASEAIGEYVAAHGAGRAAESALARAGLPPSTDRRALLAWFDEANRMRAQLRTTLRQDLMLTELLRRWG